MRFVQFFSRKLGCPCRLRIWPGSWSGLFVFDLGFHSRNHFVDGVDVCHSEVSSRIGSDFRMIVIGKGWCGRFLLIEIYSELGTCSMKTALLGRMSSVRFPGDRHFGLPSAERCCSINPWSGRKLTSCTRVCSSSAIWARLIVGTFGIRETWSYQFSNGDFKHATDYVEVKRRTNVYTSKIFVMK